MPWLARGRHIGHVVDLLHRMRLTERGFTSSDIHFELDEYARRRKKAWMSPDEQRDPLAFFAWHLRQAIPTHAEPRRLAHDRERKHRAERAVAETRAWAKRSARAITLDEAASADPTVRAMLDKLRASPTYRNKRNR